MEETVLKQNAINRAEKNLRAWAETHDLKFIADNAVFKNFATGEVYKGKAEIGAMLHYIYQVAFKAKAEVTSLIVTENFATLEGFFKGRHIGDFAGIPATNKEVDVPLCVTYRLKDGIIQEGHVFLQLNVMMQQLGVAGKGNKTTYVVRDVFKLKFGHFRDVKALIDEARSADLFPESEDQRILSDFTGHSYRLILEHGFNGLGDYEQSLTADMATPEFQKWYAKFTPHVESSFREILKQVN